MPKKLIATVQSVKPVKITLNARRTLEGNILILDHVDIDIVVNPAFKKIVAFPKPTINTDRIYESQQRLFEFLANEGIVEREKVQGGMLQNTMECKYPEKSVYAGDTTEVTLLAIDKFLKKELGYMDHVKAYDDRQIKKYTEPSKYTDLGDIEVKPPTSAVKQISYPYIWERK